MALSLDKLYLVHILESIEKIEKYTEAGPAHFVNDEKTKDAVLRNLQVLAESTMRISKDLKDDYPNVLWREIRGFRNIVVHDYLGVEFAKVWAIITEDLPALKIAVESMIRKIG